MRAARLSVTEGNERGREIPLVRDSVVLGRSGAADFTIDDDRMSRHHARISSRDGLWTIEDLGSANGTRLNGADVKTSAPLRHGDEIGVGHTTMRFELVDDPPPPAPAPAAPAAPARADADGGLVGRNFGGYEVLEQIGRGAVGFVYRARQTSLDREVALKVLAPRFAADPEFVRRFVEESAAAARLSHPNVVQVYDAGSDQGLHYFSMELMRGGSLYQRLTELRGERFSVHAALSAVLDAARGMQFAETCGIIHRDIKPDNLMLTEDGVVKIGDLGIAVRVGDEDVKRSGTPAYLAPEIVNGEPPSAASDIYGLGATLYRLLSGRKPYDDVGAVETIRRVREGPPPPLESVAPSLPPWVYDLVERMMARRPKDRPKSAGEIVETIERMRLDREVKKAAKAAAARPRSPLFAAAAYVVLVGGGLGVAVLYALRELPESSPTTPPTITPAAQPPVVDAQPERPDVDPATALARDAVAALIRKESALGAVELARTSDWRALVAEYDAFPKKFPDAARQIATTRKRSAFISEALRRLEDSDKKAEEERRRAWSELRAQIEALERDEKWTEAVEVSERTLSNPAFKPVFQQIDESSRYLLHTADRARDSVRASLDAVLARARVLRSAGGLTGALDLVAKWADRVRPHAAKVPQLDEIVAVADAWVESARGGETQRLAYVLASDVEAMTKAVAASAACRGDTAAFRFADARAALSTFLPDAKTSLVRRRVERRLARLAAAESAWSAFVAKFARGEIVPDGAPMNWVPGLPPSVATKLALGRTPTIDGFSLDLVLGGARDRRNVAWAGLPVDAVATNLLAPVAARSSGADAAGLLWLCVEMRQPAVAAWCLARAGLPPAEEAAARIELDAVKERTVADARSDHAAAIGQWRERHAAADAAVTIDAAVRPTPADLFDASDLKTYSEGGGVEPR